MNNICFCIPARYASSRLKHKLLLNLNGETCIRKTIKQVIKSKYANIDGNKNIYVLTDSELIKENIKDLPVNIILTSENYKNGSERISKNLHQIYEKYNIVVNIQADEPFISPINMDHCINKHIINNESNLFYTTLHEERNSEEYLKSTASLKMITDINNNVLYYSRNLIPWNKNGKIIENYKYKTFTGIYVFNRNLLEKYGYMKDTELQIMEDCEQLKILENGYKIKSYPTIEYNEISLNTREDYEYLTNKYNTIL